MVDREQGIYAWEGSDEHINDICHAYIASFLDYAYGQPLARCQNSDDHNGDNHDEDTHP